MAMAHQWDLVNASEKSDGCAAQGLVGPQVIHNNKHSKLYLVNKEYIDTVYNEWNNTQNEQVNF